LVQKRLISPVFTEIAPPAALVAEAAAAYTATMLAVWRIYQVCIRGSPDPARLSARAGGRRNIAVARVAGG
jgi:hypothetical protein